MTADEIARARAQARVTGGPWFDRVQESISTGYRVVVQSTQSAAAGLPGLRPGAVFRTLANFEETLREGRRAPASPRGNKVSYAIATEDGRIRVIGRHTLTDGPVELAAELLEALERKLAGPLSAEERIRSTGCRLAVLLIHERELAGGS